MSLLAALLLAQAAAPAPASYRALGTAPLWNAEITNEWMFFDTPGRDSISVPVPPRQETELGFAHSTDALSISVEHGACTDRLTGRDFADLVRVRVGDSEYEGCGGRSLSAGIPVTYGAAGSEPFWSLEIADGRLIYRIDERPIIVPAPRPRVTGDGRMRAYVAPGIRVVLRRRQCEDEGMQVFADTVTVTTAGRTVQGCGGRLIRAAPEE